MHPALLGPAGTPLPKHSIVIQSQESGCCTEWLFSTTNPSVVRARIY